MSEYGNVLETNILEDFIEKTFCDVKTVNEDEELHFCLENGETYIFYHEQDCCESVTIDDICGELSDLVGSPITMAEEVTHESTDTEYGDSQTYTFYKFATAKGYVTVRWYGTSNGYYSESVDFRKEVNNASKN